jgi:hypothetical protein
MEDAQGELHFIGLNKHRVADTEAGNNLYLYSCNKLTSDELDVLGRHK